MTGILEKIKRLFMSKKKKLILDIKKKHKKNITDEDINDYRRKNKLYQDSTSDVDILGLILLGDVEGKSTATRNTEKVESSTSRNYDYYNSNSYSDSGSYCSSSSSDSCSC